MKINDKQATDRVMKMMAVPGKSTEEKQIHDWVVQELLKAGVPESAISNDSAHKKSPSGGEVGNLIVKLKGTVKGPRRLLMAHLDTVPLAVGCKPVLKSGVIRPASGNTALGGDNRAGCAVVLTAVLEILKQKLPHPPLTLLFTVQEEIGLRGARYLTASKLGKPELCFNWDGRDPADLTIGAVGASHLKITVGGIASHAGGHPEDGVNAAVTSAKALADLQENGWHGQVVKGNNRGASNVGMINGGAATNVVMPECVIHAEARSHKAAFQKKIVGEWKKAFQTAVKTSKNAAGKKGTLSFEEDIRYTAFKIPATTDCVKIASNAVKDVGLNPIAGPCDGGLDANWMAAHGFPAVTLGCGQHGIHTVDETLNVKMFLQACEIGLRLATAS